ncbi:MAG: PKD domain-containing protein [Candidatus Hydrogenedens sp.]|nr:PKD domain-containing protein [Candidatus Hydrogenedens sp.]
MQPTKGGILRHNLKGRVAALMAYRFIRLITVLLWIPLASGCLFPPRVEPTVPEADFAALPLDAVPTEGEPDFTDAPDTYEIFEGDSLQFYDLSDPGSSPIVEWAWSFGDGLGSDEQNPVHAFDRLGTFDVRLYVANKNGAADLVRSAYVKVSRRGLPEAQFSAGPLRGLDPLVVRFKDESIPGSDPIDSWYWDFGDGRTSTSRNPVHEYLREGLFTASLTVYTLAGQDTFVRPDYIAVVPPIAPAFSASITSGPAPLTVQFTDESDTGPGFEPQWFWNFGDGSTSIAQHPSHRYVAPGKYDVVLTVKTTRDSATLIKKGYVEVLNNGVPRAAFDATPTSGPAPLTVKFTDQSIAGSRPITGWLWDFGDESTSEEQNPFHEYQEPGVYTVSLTSSSDAGANTVVQEEYIIVEGPLTADFTSDVQEGFAPLTVTFEDTSSQVPQEILTRLWRFGDGSTSDEEAPEHTFENPGSYDVSLTVTTASESSTETKADYIVVNAPEPPVAEFSAAPTEGRAPLAVSFTNESEAGDGDDLEFAWEFGDGGTDSEENPEYVYDRLGTYSVSLTATTSLGSSSETKVDLIRVRTADQTFGSSGVDEAYGLAMDATSRYVMAGVTRGEADTLDVFLRIAGADGNLAQERLFDFGLDDQAFSLARNADGSLVLAGAREMSERGYDILVMKLDSSGNAIWSRTYGGLGQDAAASIRPVPDGGYIVAGLSVPEDAEIPNALLLRLDKDGNVIWQIEPNGSGFEEFSDAIPTAEGGFAAVGTASAADTSNTRIYFLLADGQGNVLNQRALGSGRDQNGTRILQMASRDFVVFGNTVASNGVDLNLLGVRFPVSGASPSVLYESTNSNREVLNDAIALPGGGYLLAGDSTGGTGESDGLLVLLTSAFAETARNTYGGAQADRFEAVAARRDGNGAVVGYAAAGSSDSFADSGRDAYLIHTKTDLSAIVFPD